MSLTRHKPHSHEQSLIVVISLITGLVVFFCYQEKNNVLGLLAQKAKMVTETFNAIEGVSCNVVQGAMYAFPRVDIPEKAIAEAKV